MSEDKDAKTEDPTSKRLSKAREEGDIPVSQEIKSVAMLLAGLVVIGTLAPWVAKELTVYLRQFIERPHTMHTDVIALRALMAQLTWRVSLLMAFPMAVLVVAALVSNIAQSGLNFTPNKLMPKLSNMNPIAGAKQLFSMRSLIEAGKGVIKIAVVGALVGAFVVPTINHPEQIIDQDIVTTMKEIHWVIVMVFFVVVLAMSVLAAGDLLYQRWAHNEKLKMTKQEVKDEHKESEGDPKIKGKIRALRMARHRNRMMANVPKASVIITNPTHYAVALQYDMDGAGAPKVVAKGVDYIAKRIRQLAQDNDVPIVESPPLARALYAAVEVDQEIPQEHYKAVAEIIGYVMRLKKQPFATPPPVLN